MPNEQQPYGFILNAGAEPRKKMGWLPTGGSKKQRIIIAAIGAILLLIIFWMIFSLFLNNKGGLADQTLKLAQEHTELLRITDIGTSKARSADARNLASTTKLSLQSTSEQVISIAKKYQKVEPKKLSAGKNPKTDEVLTRADQRNEFDKVFTDTIVASLRTYLAQVKAVHDASSVSQDKQALAEVYKKVSDLLPNTTGSD